MQGSGRGRSKTQGWGDSARPTYSYACRSLVADDVAMMTRAPPKPLGNPIVTNVNVCVRPPASK
eukprot:11173802-Lingulodinium_polyedra.AAC.1